MSDFNISVNGKDFNVSVEEKVSSNFVKSKAWRDPEPYELKTLWFNQIWDVIKDWDIAVPGAYDGYCGATGNHVVAILDAIKTHVEESFDEDEQWR